MNRRRAELAFSALLSVAGHAAVIGGFSVYAGRAALRAHATRPERHEAVVVLAAERARAILEPQAVSRLPSPREAPPRSHTVELASTSRAAERPPSPPVAPLPARPRVEARPSDILLPEERAPRPEERLTPPPAPVVTASSPPRPPDAEPDPDVAETESSLAPLDSSAVILHRPPLSYPPAAYRAGIEGTVLVGLQTADGGSVERVWLLRGSGTPLLDRAALDNVRRWRFDPTTIEAGARFRQSIRFTLR